MKRCSFLKKAISVLITLAMLITVLAVPTEAASIESAEKAVKAINAGWNLGNCLDSCG